MLKIFGFSKKEKITVKDLASIYSRTLFEVIDLGFSEIIDFVNDNRKFEESPNLKMEDANWFLMIIFAANNNKAKIGLPEIKVGIFPGAGGTTRLVRKLGIFGASEFLLEGKTVDPIKAKSSGIIDEVSDTPMSDAKAWVLSASDADIVKPWDQKGSCSTKRSTRSAC